MRRCYGLTVTMSPRTESLGGVLTGVLRRKMLLRTLRGVLRTPSRAISGLRTIRTRSPALINATDKG